MADTSTPGSDYKPGPATTESFLGTVPTAPIGPSAVVPAHVGRATAPAVPDVPAVSLGSKPDESMQDRLRELDNVPGHGDNRQEARKADRALVCIQFSPVPGRILTVTDPNDPVLAKWVWRKEQVYFIRNDENGDLKQGMFMDAEEAKRQLIKYRGGK